MGAFRGAVEVGAHAIETDLHLSKDGVVVLSHVSKLPIMLIKKKLVLIYISLGCKPQEMLWTRRQDH